MKVKYKKYTFEQIDKETARPTLCVIISAKYSGQSQNDTQTMTFFSKNMFKVLINRIEF